jgi:acid phosphatase type 7
VPASYYLGTRRRVAAVAGGGVAAIGLAAAVVWVLTIEPEVLVVAAAGDISCPDSEATTAMECRQRATAEVVEALDPDLVLALGDLQYPDGQLTEFKSSYEPSWGAFKDRTRPVPGNHEYGTEDAAGYFGYFGDVAGNPAQGWYSFDSGGWHFVALNSECGEVGGCEAGSAQHTWLTEDLASADARCTLAFWHHARFSSGVTHGSDDSTRDLWQTLYDNGGDLLLVSHEHLYERFAPQTADGSRDDEFGVVQFTVGTGGRSLYELAGSREPNSEAANGSTFGVLRLSLEADGYAYQFMPAAGGDFTDSGEGSCHGPPPVNRDTLQPPRITTARAEGVLGVRLSWNEVDYGVRHYRVYRDGREEPIATVSATTYTDATATPGSTHSYAVTAVTEDGRSALSSSVLVTTPPATEGQQYVFTPTDDATIEKARPQERIGDRDTLSADGTPRSDFLLRFTVATGCSRFEQARVVLSSAGASDQGGKIFAVGSDWTEDTVTWDSAPAADTMRLDTVRGAVAAGGSYSLDVTSAVTADGDTSFRVGPRSEDGIEYWAREAGEDTSPRLHVVCS